MLGLHGAFKDVCLYFCASVCMLYEIYGYMWESLGHFLQATAIRLTGTDRNPFDMSRHPVDTPLTPH